MGSQTRGSNSHSRNRNERAVVIGASMAGLAVARALSDHFRGVVVLERDAFAPGKPAARARVPQRWHIRNLTIGGQRELETLFPGFVASALALGAMRLDHAADVPALPSTAGRIACRRLLGSLERMEEMVCAARPTPAVRDARRLALRLQLALLSSA